MSQAQLAYEYLNNFFMCLPGGYYRRHSEEVRKDFGKNMGTELARALAERDEKLNLVEKAISGLGLNPEDLTQYHWPSSPEAADETSLAPFRKIYIAARNLGATHDELIA